jgi:hypothetical protein
LETKFGSPSTSNQYLRAKAVKADVRWAGHPDIKLPTAYNLYTVPAPSLSVVLKWALIYRSRFNVDKVFSTFDQVTGWLILHTR